MRAAISAPLVHTRLASHASARVGLVSAFLLSLPDPAHRDQVEARLCLKRHRTGKRRKDILAPLSRRSRALSRHWDDPRPPLTCFLSASSDPFAVGSLISLLERGQKKWG